MVTRKGPIAVALVIALVSVLPAVWLATESSAEREQGMTWSVAPEGQSPIATGEQAETGEVSVVRLGGANRFATAKRVAEHHVRDPERVYLATGEDFPDALAVGAVAGAQGAPVLLAGGEVLPQETAAALQGASPNEVVVAGGQGAVSDSVAREAARSADASLRRIAGRNRYETARLLAEEAAQGSSARAAALYLASGSGFADALAGGAAAAGAGAPLMLTSGGGHAAVLGASDSVDPAEVKVLGGPRAVLDGIVERLRRSGDAPVHRLAGPDRFATAVAVSEDRFEDVDTVYLASGMDFPDALTGGAAAGAANAPFLLTPSRSLPAAVARELTRLAPSRLVVLGGRDALAEQVVTQAVRAIGGKQGSAPGDPEPPQDDAEGSPPERDDDGGGQPEEDSDDVSDDIDRVVSGHMRVEGFTVPEGETWAFDPEEDTTVETSENVVVRGTLQMKPVSAAVTHTLEFVGVDETAFQGGHTETPLDSDVGLWVVDDGQLDLQGTERAGWNRSGNDPSWRDQDELRRAPVDVGQTSNFPRFRPGDAVPSVTAPDGSLHRTEVFNLTRNVRIHGGGSNPPGEVLDDDGRAHVICLKCNQPQTIKHVEFRWLGPRAPHDRDGTSGRLGRYALHFHHGASGTRGTIVEGTVVRDAGNHAYVPHGSHGITFDDTLSFDTYESAYWWDEGDETEDLRFNRAAAFLTQDYPESRGYSLDGFTLGQGTNMSVQDSVVAGLQGNGVNSGGFHWPSSANQVENNVWVFDKGNVAHNNRGNGLSVWQNDSNEHIVEDFIGYRNDQGILHGAYRNTYVYRDVLLFGNSTYDVRHKALSNHPETDGVLFENVDLGTLRLAEHAAASDLPVTYRNVRVRDQVVVDEDQGAAGVFRFEYDCAHQDRVVQADDFDLVAPLSDIVVLDKCSGERAIVHEAS